MIYITKDDYNLILSHAENNLPEEACGLLGGVVDGDDKYVKKVYLLENTDHSNEHFTMSPQAQFQSIKDMRQNGYVLLGNWHSHPESPSRPSEEDKRLAMDTKIRYLILSLMDNDNPVLNAFIIDKDKNVSKEEINVFKRKDFFR